MKIKMQSNNDQIVNKFYVYGHYTKNNTPYYIGVGKILNLKSKTISHIYSRAYKKSNRTKFWKSVYKKHGLIVKILSEFFTKREALDEEKRLISLFGRRWNKTGILCNISSGGEIGAVGRFYKMSKEQKDKLSEIMSIKLYVYNNLGKFLKEIKTIKATAKYCGVTYNAIHSCMKTKNFSNGYFIFKTYKGENLGYTEKDLNFKSPLSKIVISEDNLGNKIEHESISACARYLKRSKSSVQQVLGLSERRCNEHKIYLKAESAAKPL